MSTSQTIKNITSFNFIWLVIFAIVAFFFFVGIQLDLLFNRDWLTQSLEGWRWWNYFTSEHSLSVMYLKGWTWLLPPLGLSLLVATGVYFRKD